MKNIFYLLLFVSNGLLAQYTAIPDADFEQKLIELGVDSDLTINSQVLTSDIDTINHLYINNSNLHNIIGIEDFTALQSLEINNCNNLTSLDMSGNLNLYSLICRNDSISSLNITNNTALLYLVCYNNNLTSLDVSNNSLLWYLGCWGNQLTTLDVSNNTNLSTLYCNNNNLTSIDVSQNINLVELFCYNNQLTTLEINNNPQFLLLSCSNNLLTSLTITNTPEFSRLHCSNNLLSTLNLNNFPAIKSLVCSNNLLTELNLSNNPQLKTLYCDNNYITNLNMNTNSQLEIFWCFNNNLSTLEIQNGANNLLNGTYQAAQNNFYNRFDATNNSNLTCIYVDDVANCISNWLGVDTTSHFVSTTEECNNLTTETFDYSNLNIYPNPAKDYIIIDIENETIKSVSIFDCSGKKVIDKITNLNKVDISNLVKGLYLIRVETENNLISTKKIIIE